MKSLFLIQIALVVGLLLLVSPAGQTQDPATPQEEAAELLREAQETLRVLNRISEAFPREPLEPAQLVEQVHGKKKAGVEKLTQWVAESVDWLPYRGALRGPRGVLIERRGNSLDQSLLLAESLGKCGYEVRLANMQLPLEVAGSMVSASREPGVEEADEASGPSDEEYERFSKVLGVEPDQLRQTHSSLEIKGQQYLEQVLPMTVTQAEGLKRLLAENGVSAVDDQDTSEAAAMADHWWVQATRDGGDWSDCDPVAQSAGIEFDHTPERTCAIDELPESMRHRVELRVVAERVSPAGRETGTALTHVADAIDLAGTHFLLSFSALNAAEEAAPTGNEAETGAYTLRVAKAETEWLPILATVDYRGKTDVAQEASIYTDGTLNPKPILDTKSRKIGKAAMSLRDADRKATANNSHLTSVWIEYQISGPGAEEGTIRRRVFDLLGESDRAGGVDSFELDDDQAVRRGLALTGRTQILPVTCNLSGDFVVRMDLWTKLKNQRLMVQLAQSLTNGDGDKFPDLASSFATPPLELFMLARMRTTVGRYPGRVFLGGLNVLANHVQPVRPTPERAKALTVNGIRPALVYGRAIDIVANDMGVLTLPEGAESAAKAWDVRLEQGVLDTVLENLSLVGTDERSEPEDEWTKRAAAENTAVWMSEHPVDGWKVVREAEALVDASDDTQARVASALSEGRIAVMPNEALAASDGEWRPGCWWSVDAATGRTLGIGPRGWGQEIVEDLEFRVNLGMRWVDPIRSMDATVLCFFATVAARLVVGVAAGAIGEAAGSAAGDPAGGAGIMSVVMAMISQAGYAGVMYQIINLRCRLLIMRIPGGVA